MRSDLSEAIEEKKEQVGHTPGPWTLEGAAIIGMGAPVALVSSTRADARFIVRACNAHDDLLAVVKDFAALDAGRLGFGTRFRNRVNAAIVKAE